MNVCGTWTVHEASRWVFHIQLRQLCGTGPISQVKEKNQGSELEQPSQGCIVGTKAHTVQGFKNPSFATSSSDTRALHFQIGNQIVDNYITQGDITGIRW